MDRYIEILIDIEDECSHFTTPLPEGTLIWFPHEKEWSTVCYDGKPLAGSIIDGDYAWDGCIIRIPRTKLNMQCISYNTEGFRCSGIDSVAHLCKTCSCLETEIHIKKEGLKHDTGKQKYHAMPLIILGPLADTFKAGTKKYAKFNCLEPFTDSDSRFWDGAMRHMQKCQLDPLAIDEETGCYHAAQVAFNTLLRLYNALKEADGNVNNSQKDLEHTIKDSYED